jgi:hypothetical protein
MDIGEEIKEVEFVPLEEPAVVPTPEPQPVEPVKEPAHV